MIPVQRESAVDIAAHQRLLKRTKHRLDCGASKSRFLAVIWAEMPELDHDHDDPSLTELAKLAPLMAPLPPP